MAYMKSDSDLASMATSSPRSSPKALPQVVYYVQSPSRDSHEEDKLSTSASPSATRVTTPAELRSPSDAVSLFSLLSRVSGPHGFRRKGRRERERERGRGLLSRPRHVEGLEDVKEEEPEDEEKDIYVNWWRNEEGEELSRSCKVLRCMLFLALFFLVGCFIIWCVSKPFVAQIHLKDMKVNNFYYGEGSDIRGVPTKMLTVNCTLNVAVHNTATFFGIHVTCSTIILRYYHLTIASGQKKSWRKTTVNIEGRNIPLYGAGAGFMLSNHGNGVPLILEFVMWTQGNVVGKLIKAKHRQNVTCFLNINSNTEIAQFRGDSCRYR
ncbi:hypothetical protein RND81_07G098500 [Saponaria officinalis]|uniref:Late embryogenesis abundant protein LEA-2 subgroup domain-containing protein n=1 Tax=Saponaria officinalis TaxID=3572 RepID=A0AAW1JQW4_SAPOF